MVCSRKCFFFSSRRRHTRWTGDWSSDVCSSDLEVWTSDNTEAFDRLKIQEGFTYAYTPKVMMAWVTDVPNMNGRSTPLSYRFLVAMQGSLGIGSNLNKWAQADFGLATKMVAYYKQIRETVQTGNL